MTPIALGVTIVAMATIGWLAYWHPNEPQGIRRFAMAAFLMAAGTTAFAALQIRRAFLERREGEQAMRSAYVEIDERIRTRTKELSDANERLRGSEEHFRVIAEVSPIHLFAYERNGAATYVSPGFSRLTGLGPERTAGLGWIDTLHPDDRMPVMSGWRAALERGQRFQSEFRVLEAAGTHRWFRLRVVPVRNEHNEILQWAGAAADIHEHHELLAARASALEREQEARTDAERASQLKDEFLGTVSHELRTPLNAIVGWVHLLKTGALSAKETRQAIDAIDRNARSQTRLVEDLLDVSRLIQGRVSLHAIPCDLRAVVAGVLENLQPAAGAKQLEVEVRDDESDVTVAGDEARLKQIAWNLLANAVKFTPNGGHIMVDVGRVDGRARLRVTDSGEGLDPAFLPHVFDTFRQDASRSKRAGLGMGLAIVRHLVELHGGTVLAESDGPGRGASFTVSLPVRTSMARARSEPVPRSGTPGVRVLVAEDDPDSAEVVRTLLLHLGYEARTVASAGEFLSVLVRWRPQVLVCDLGLPDEDGYSLLKRVRALQGFSGVPAIALTARAGDEDRKRALEAGYLAHRAR